MDRLGHGFAALLFAGLALFWGVVLAGAMALSSLPGEADGRMAAFFPPSFSENDALGAIVDAGGQPLDSLLDGRIWIVAGEGPGFVRRLKDRGALFALRELPAAPGMAGCVYVVAKPLDERFSPITR